MSEVTKKERQALYEVCQQEDNVNDYNTLERHDLIQKLQTGNGLPPKEPYDYDWIIAMLSGALITGAIIIGFQSCVKRTETTNHSTINCSDCHNKYTSYFHRKGSSQPERMAYAVAQTRNPRLLSAIAITESNGRPELRNTGWKRRHHGAFQVNPRDWGNVGHSAVEQALQADMILQELTASSNGNIIKALNAYGGDKTRKKYAFNVLDELKEVPK